MMRSLFSAVSGLKSHQTAMDVIGNNVANVNTKGYKSAGRFSRTSTARPSARHRPHLHHRRDQPKQVGTGRLHCHHRHEHDRGQLPVHLLRPGLRISGEGFFVVDDGCEPILYKNGALTLDAEGTLSPQAATISWPFRKAPRTIPPTHDQRAGKFRPCGGHLHHPHTPCFPGFRYWATSSTAAAPCGQVHRLRIDNNGRITAIYTTQPPAHPRSEPSEGSCSPPSTTRRSGKKSGRATITPLPTAATQASTLPTTKGPAP